MQDLTAGNVTRHLLRNMGFMLVTMVFQTLYFLADLYWVGRLGAEAVAAVAVAGNITFVVLAATQMLSVGTTTLVSHAAGRKERDRANLVFNQSLVLGALCAVMFFTGAMLLERTYATGLAADAWTATLARDYLAWFIPAMALQFPVATMGAALRGTGQFKPGMVVQTATVIINIVITPMLMFGWPVGPARGVSGAALGTFIALVVANVWLAAYFGGSRAYLHVRQDHWAPQVRLWRDILKVGLPAGAEFALMAVYLVLVHAVIRPFGAAAQAGFGIGLRVNQAFFMPQVALGISVAPVAGQNFGAGRGARVRQTFRSAAALAAGFALAAATVCLLVPDPFVRLFADDPQVVEVGALYLRIAAAGFVASAEVFVIASLFQAMGNTIPPLLVSAARLLLVGGVIVGLAMTPSLTLASIWWVATASSWLQLGAVYLLLQREFRRRLPDTTEEQRSQRNTESLVHGNPEL